MKNKKIFKTKTTVLLITLLGIFVALGLILLVNNVKSGVDMNEQQKSDLSNNDSVDIKESFKPTANRNKSVLDVPKDWEIYKSEVHSFSIMYPPDINIEQRERNALRFTKWGPMQTEGTELFDAISLTFNSGSLNNETLQSFVESKFEEERNSPVSKVSSELKTITLSNMTGYEFSVRGLGEFKHIYLPNGSDKYLWIVDGTEDPNDQGFTEAVEKMLSTLETGI